MASGWLGHLARDRSFRWNGDFDTRVQMLTLEQVNAAIRKWIAPASVNWSLAGEFDKPTKADKPNWALPAFAGMTEGARDDGMARE
ncbi:MAG: hypothetical protein IPJ08_07165 [Burkholderiales bacterium]|nr:hypothetical protein [Burkholderiales bacterium]